MWTISINKCSQHNYFLKRLHWDITHIYTIHHLNSRIHCWVFVCLFCSFTTLWNYHHNLILEHFVPTKGNPISLAHSHPSSSPTLSNDWSVFWSINWSNLSILNQLTHTTCAFLLLVLSHSMKHIQGYMLYHELHVILFYWHIIY